MSPRRLVVMWLLAVSLSFAGSDPLSPSAKYDPAIPTLEKVLGYKMGEDFTSHHLLTSYYQALAAASPRVKIEAYGKTAEGRPLNLVIISSPENLARLAAIKESVARLNDPRKTNQADADAIAASTPVIVFLSYGVHGNEASSAEAAMQVAYELAASQDTANLERLQNSVIVIDPLVNPDGRERFVQGYRSVKGANAISDRFAAEQQERWPSGRYSHYLFDLNRDWTWQSQAETRARVAAYRSWSPQLHVDYHEMGSGGSYHFAPPAEPILDSLNTPMHKKWFELYGKANAQAFDQQGFRFFTHENYDLFYPGFGDSWPLLNGAIGMTFEQAGGRAGLSLELADNQRTLTLRDRALRHFVTSLATIDVTVKNRVERLKDYYAFRKSAITMGEQSAERFVYIVPGGDAERAERLVNSLLRQGIEVQQAKGEFEAARLTNYWGQKFANKKLSSGAYVVDMAQPLGYLVRALLEREAKLESTFFYDVTAWSMPFAAGVEAYTGGPAGRGEFKPVTAAVTRTGALEGAQEATAFVFSSEPMSSVRLLGYLLQADIKVFTSTQAFKQSGHNFPIGSLIVPTESNPPQLGFKLKALAQKAGAVVYAVNSTRSDSGVDLGSNRVRFLRKPKIAVLMDSPVSATDYGFIWHSLEQVYDVPFTPIKVENLGAADLNSYNVIILPPDQGEGRGYARAISSIGNRLGDWVRNGGVLVGIRGGAVFASKKRSGLSSVTYKFLARADEEARIEEEKTAPKKDEPGSSEPPPPPSKEEIEKERASRLERKLRKYADKEKELQRESVPGTILKTQLDNTHPLGYGMAEQLAILDQDAPILELSDKGDNIAYFPKEGVKLSGFITAENEKKLGLTAYAIRERQGRGFVILFADNPVFRGFWDATDRLLLNAIYFGRVTNPGVE
ncbi:MAG TPA: M14 family zinc carboxypeptidase [Terriglobales bacterium]|nr:M14 family zinc carboxypeptidase [Terriglobales bacterium]